MNIKREEILPGVFLNHLQSEKFKTSCLSLSLLSQLSRETASMNALIPAVLRRGTVSCPDMESISARLDNLYGTVIEPSVRRVGEVQAVGFVSSFPESAYLPGREDILREVCGFLSEMLLSPLTRGGLFLPAYVDSEKEKLIDIINGLINEKRSYALTRCVQEMCCFEPMSVGRWGSVDDCMAINYKKLTRQYRSLLLTSPVEIFYCGRESFGKVSKCLEDAFCTLPRGEIDYDIGTEIRLNSVEEGPRYYEEELDVTQGKLVIGFRLGDCMMEPDLAAMYVFNAVYGSGVTSKLFMNVREKLSLCYYAASMLDWHKGLLLVSSGIEFSNLDAAKDEIMHQLDEVKNGNITEEELAYAKAGIKSDFKALLDSQMEMESFSFANIIEGSDASPEELSALVDEVSFGDVVSIANSLECDMIYFLKGPETGCTDVEAAENDD